MNSSHIIHSLEFDITAGSTERATALSDRIGLLARERMAGVIEQALDRHARSDTVTRIGRLELDLGTILFDTFESDFLERVKAAAEAGLAEILSGSAPLSEQVRHTPETVSLLEQLRIFLTSGVLPWNAEPVRFEEPDRLFGELMRHETTAFVRMMRQIASEPPIRRRMIFTFAPDNLTKLMEAAFATDTNRVRDVVRAIREIRDRHPFAKTAVPAKVFIFDGLLAQLPEDVPSSPPAVLRNWFVRTFSLSPHATITREILETPDFTNIATGAAATISEDFRGPLLEAISEVGRYLGIGQKATRQTESPPPKKHGIAPADGEKDEDRPEQGQQLKAEDASAERKNADTPGHAADIPEETRRPRNIPMVAGPVPDVPPSEQPASVAGQKKSELPSDRPMGTPPGLEDKPPEARDPQPDGTFSSPREPMPGLWFPDALPEKGEWFVQNSGLVLLWPYFQRYFETLGLTRENQFASPEHRFRALFALEALVRGNAPFQEYHLVLNKVLCGIRLAEPVDMGFKTKIGEYVGEAENLLKNAIVNWRIIKNTSVGGFRQAFLSRDGKLSGNGTCWKLIIDRRGYDVLLDHLPYTIFVVKLPWMNREMYIEW